MSRQPRLTVIAAFHNMGREAPRTLLTLSSEYQRGVHQSDYEVVAVDNGSSEPLREEDVTGFGGNFRLVRDEGGPSPGPALNRAAAGASTPLLMCLIDGARMLSPGVLAGALGALGSHPNGFVYTLNLQLGRKPQNLLAARGYSTREEDELLASVDWRADGYRLFTIATRGIAGHGFFDWIRESNCFAVRRQTFLDLGGFEQGFRTPGGGMANPDLFKRFVEHPDLTPVCLLGEATFHQFHGGVSTNARPREIPARSFTREYRAMRGASYVAPERREPVYYGEIPSPAQHLGRLRGWQRIRTWATITARRARLLWWAIAGRWGADESRN